MPRGMIVALFGDRCEVDADHQRVSCRLRGRLKREDVHLAVGDEVEFTCLEPGQGIVERALTRRSRLARGRRERPRRTSKRGPRRHQEQTVVVNIDQVLYVTAARQPGLSLELLDRALALAEASHLPIVICINKMDLAPAASIEDLMRPYEALGHQILYFSALTEETLTELNRVLRERTSVLWGSSGVGKSTIIRALTGEDVKVGRWRDDNPRGPHTTSAVRLYPLPQGGYLADTPGFDWLALDTLGDGANRERLLFPEAEALAADCRFPDCSHTGEPGCAVMAAVLTGEIDQARYARYRAALAEESPEPPPHRVEIVAFEDDLLFRVARGSAYHWEAFRMFRLFQAGRTETGELLRRLGLSENHAAPIWAVWHREQEGSRVRLTAKISSLKPMAAEVQKDESIILREQGVVKGLGKVRACREQENVWRVRKALRYTPVYEARAFWSDLKPPEDAALPPVYGGVLRLHKITEFAMLPEMGFGVLSRTEAGLTLDYLEVGSSEDEMDNE